MAKIIFKKWLTSENETAKFEETEHTLRSLPHPETTRQASLAELPMHIHSVSFEQGEVLRSECVG
jgi:hypothetical protein